ncbi:MAG: sulfotransferase [Proteobacteria bacterium]|nr:sulfotransferase [Pseudomonadota bacterium]
MAIFMIGTQRSGSNLLRLMLNQLPDIAAPHPPHILDRMMPVEELYGDLSSSINFHDLVDDICKLVEFNPVSWDGVMLDRDNIAERARTRNVMGVYEAVHDAMAEAWGAKEWCCKSLVNIQYLPQIETHFENAKYIYLYRDGRDVALSFKKAVVGEKHFYHIAKEWDFTQKLALAMEPNLPKERFFRISYEDLVSQPKHSMQRLCKFIGVNYLDSMMNFHESSEAQRAAESSSLWDQVAQPINADNTSKFLAEASAAEIRIFEAVAGDVLTTLGYPLHADVDARRVRLGRDEISFFDRENARLKAEVQQGMDKADQKRRDRQAALIRTIISKRLPANGPATRIQ